MGSAIARQTSKYPMENGDTTSFIGGKAYRYVQRSSGNFVFMDENNKGLELEKELAQKEFIITDNM